MVVCLLLQSCRRQTLGARSRSGVCVERVAGLGLEASRQARDCVSFPPLARGVGERKETNNITTVEVEVAGV